MIELYRNQASLCFVGLTCFAARNLNNQAHGSLQSFSWLDDFSLPHRGKTRWRGHGGGLQGRGYSTGPCCRSEVPSRRTFSKSPSPNPVSPRGPSSLDTESSQHLYNLRRRRT